MAAGLSVAAAAFMGKQAVQLYVKIAASPPALKPFYKVRATRVELLPRILGASSDEECT